MVNAAARLGVSRTIALGNNPQLEPQTYFLEIRARWCSSDPGPPSTPSGTSLSYCGLGLKGLDFRAWGLRESCPFVQSSIPEKLSPAPAVQCPLQ